LKGIRVPLEALRSPRAQEQAVTSNVVLFDQDTIAKRVDELAREIASRLPAGFIIIGLLKGSFVFVADLVRALHRHGAAPQVEFMRLSSYGLGTVSAGEVHLLGDVPSDVAGRDVLLVDDIVDTGHSLKYARAILEQRGVARTFTCALIDKPSRREVDVALDFVGFSIGDIFIAGYGIDYAERYRELPVIVAVADAG
jgi:hypoxanthine phosphoribosyltransferase